LDEANDTKIREEIRSVAKYVFYMFYQYETVHFVIFLIVLPVHNIRICLSEPHYVFNFHTSQTQQMLITVSLLFVVVV